MPPALGRMLATKTEMSKRGNDTATIMIPRASSHILVKYALASGVSLTLSVSRPCEGLLLLLRARLLISGLLLLISARALYDGYE